MTSLPAAPAMTMLAGMTHRDALYGAVTVVARRRVAHAVVDLPGIGSATTVVLREVRLEVATVDAT